VLGWPAGPELLGLAGAVLVVAGIALAGWGVAHDHDKELQLGRLMAGWRTTVSALAGVGNAARGFLVVLVGAYLLDAALASKATKAKSVDAALQSLGHQAYGASLLGVVAFGLVCFGVYSFFEARLRRL
jgi:membrane protease YdiL (CAAX protease family)